NEGVPGSNPGRGALPSRRPPPPSHAWSRASYTPTVRGLRLSRGSLLQPEGDRVRAGLAVAELLLALSQIVAVLGEPGFLEADHHKPGGGERFPVVRERPVEPEELGLEVCPRRVRAFPRLVIREVPVVRNLPAVLRHGSTALGEAGVGEDQN